MQLDEFVWDEEGEDDRVKNLLGKTVSRPGVQLKDVGMYLGEWKPGTQTIHGRGIRLDKSGNYYEGYFFNGVENFSGRLIRPNGEVYVGHLKDNKTYGKGMSKTLYPFSNQQFLTLGFFVKANGETISGNFIHGKADGMCV